MFFFDPRTMCFQAARAELRRLEALESLATPVRVKVKEDEQEGQGMSMPKRRRLIHRVSTLSDIDDEVLKHQLAHHVAGPDDSTIPASEEELEAAHLEFELQKGNWSPGCQNMSPLDCIHTSTDPLSPEMPSAEADGNDSQDDADLERDLFGDFLEVCLLIAVILFCCFLTTYFTQSNITAAHFSVSDDLSFVLNSIVRV